MPQYPRIKLLIANEWVETSPGVEVLNPFDESVLGHVPRAGRPELDAAVEAATAGLKVWRRTPPAKRAETMLRAVALVRERADEIADAVTLENGKPRAQCHAEILRGCDTLEWDAQEGRRLYGRIVPGGPGMRYLVTREPIGVVAGFSPWNFPFSSPARKIGGALAAGCSIILKASEETPAGALLLARAFVDAGLPPGVLNLVYGVPAEISEFLISHASVRLVTFTGSVPVGKRLAELAGRHMKPVIMELGGHSPVIVCDDVDPVAAARASVVGKLRNSGQVCVSPTRFFVQERIFAPFVEEFGRRASELRVGNGLEETTQMGPLLNARRLEAIDGLVQDAVRRGATLISGGQRLGNQGFLYPMTVLSQVPESAKVMQEEPFGPIAIVNPVGDLDEAVASANAVPYGLAAYAFTRSAERAERLANGLECGNLSINHFTASVAEIPFGGVKDSGYGREGGTEGLDRFTITKAVSHLVSFGADA